MFKWGAWHPIVKAGVKHCSMAPSTGKQFAQTNLYFVFEKMIGTVTSLTIMWLLYEDELLGVMWMQCAGGEV